MLPRRPWSVVCRMLLAQVLGIVSTSPPAIAAPSASLHSPKPMTVVRAVGSASPRHLAVRETLVALEHSATARSARADKRLVVAMVLDSVDPRRLAVQHTLSAWEQSPTDVSVDVVTLSLGQEHLITATPINRFVATTPGIITLQHLPDDGLLIQSVSPGETLLHYWVGDEHVAVRIRVERPATAYVEHVTDSRDIIRLEVGSSVTVDGDSVTRFLAVDPEVVAVQRLRDGTIGMVALARGVTFVHLWSPPGRRTIRVQVAPPSPQLPEALSRRPSVADDRQTFWGRYSMTTSTVSVKSDFDDNEFRDHRFTQAMDVHGEVPQGTVNVELRLQGEDTDTDNVTELTYAQFELLNDYYGLRVGDTDVDYSNLTLSYEHLQGVHWWSDVGERFRYELLWGANGQRLYGDSILTPVLPDPYIGGVRAEAGLSDRHQINLTGLMGRGADPEDISEEVLAFEDVWTFDRGLWRSEIAVGDGDVAWEAGGEVRPFAPLRVGGVWRDYAPSYDLVTGDISFRGEEGAYLFTDYHVKSGWDIGLSYDLFRERFQPNVNEPGQRSSRLRGTFSAQLPWQMSLSGVAWKLDDASSQFPTLNEGATGRLSYTLEIGQRPVELYSSATSRSFKQIETPSADFDESEFGVGARWPLSDHWHANVFHAWSFREESTESDDTLLESTPRRFRAGLAYTHRLANAPLTLDASVEYEDQSGVARGGTTFIDEDVLAANLELAYEPNADFRFFIRGRLTDFRGPIVEEVDRLRREVYTGLTWYWDSGWRWPWGIAYGELTGLVFLDYNGDGIPNPGEPGVPQAQLFVDGIEDDVQTNQLGQFRVDRVPVGSVEVMLDVTPLGMGGTSASNPTVVQVRSGERSRVEFGVLAAGTVRGVVYNDLNANSRQDSGEPGVRQVVVEVPGVGTAVTDSQGAYVVTGARPGSYSVRLDSASLSEGFAPVRSVDREVDVRVGESLHVNFAVMALRTVLGRVFLDRNGNGQYDSGEPGLGGVVVRGNGSAVATDEQGNYLLRLLPAGSVQITVDPRTLPPGLHVTTPATFVVELGVGPETVRSILFGVGSTR